MMNNNKILKNDSNIMERAQKSKRTLDAERVRSNFFILERNKGLIYNLNEVFGQYYYNIYKIATFLGLFLVMVVTLIFIIGDKSLELSNITKKISDNFLPYQDLIGTVVILFVLAMIFVEKHFKNQRMNSEKEKAKKEKRILERFKEKSISYEDATKEIDEEDKRQLEENKKNELVSGFLRVLDYHNSLINFYIWFIFGFSFISIICVISIFGISQSDLYINVDYKNTGQMIVEGFFKNIRFFIYESILITLLGYSLKRISVYISMIEVYKEFQIFTIMDVQRQNRNNKEGEKDIVSYDFQEKFSTMLSKHYDFIINNKMDINLKTDTETLNNFIKCVNKKKQ